MWVRKRLDIDAPSLVHGLIRCLHPGDSRALSESIGRFLPRPDRAMICLSVRTGFDLLLTALDFPEDSEVLMTSLTIPDMPEIVRTHRLVPVPLDLQIGTAGPDPDRLEQSITPRTKALVVAHLFGAELDMTPLIRTCREHGIFVIEDRAQAFYSPDRWGHPDVDASMFSFGTIKTSTALGGAVIQLEDDRLLRTMLGTRAAYPPVPRVRFVRRLLKAAVLNVLAQRAPYAWFHRTCRKLGIDVDRLVNGLARGFPGEQLLPQIRKRMDPRQIDLLAYRLRSFDPERIETRTKLGRLLSELLSGTVPCPGRLCERHTYWVFPVLLSWPDVTIPALRRAGFDASSQQSMEVVAPPEERPHGAPRQAKAMYERMAYLPLYPEMDEGAVREMAAIVLRSESQTVP